MGKKINDSEKPIHYSGNLKYYHKKTALIKHAVTNKSLSCV